MSNEISHVQEYREIIEKFARQRLNQRVPNGLPQHAAILIETMFKNAAAEMRIFTGELNKRVFGEPQAIEAALKFLSKPYAMLRILLQKDLSREEVLELPLVKSLNKLNDLHGRVEIVSASGTYATDEAKHFAVMDNDGYRFEFDHENCKAVANFNDPVTAKELIEAFDSAFSLARKENNPVYTLPQA